MREEVRELQTKNHVKRVSFITIQQQQYALPLFLQSKGCASDLTFSLALMNFTIFVSFAVYEISIISASCCAAFKRNLFRKVRNWPRFCSSHQIAAVCVDTALHIMSEKRELPGGDNQVGFNKRVKTDATYGEGR